MSNDFDGDDVNDRIDSQIQQMIERSRENKLRGMIQPPGVQALDSGEADESGMRGLAAQMAKEDEEEQAKKSQGGGGPLGAIAGMIGG